MPALTLTRNYATGSPLTEAHLDAIAEGIETIVNNTKLDFENFQTEGITNTSISNAAITSVKLNTSVAGAGLTGGAGSALSVVTDNTSIEINSNALRVKDGGATKAKFGVLGGGISNTSGSFATLSTTYVDICTLTTTVTGRDCIIMVVPDGTSSASRVTQGDSIHDSHVQVNFDGNTICEWLLHSTSDGDGSNYLCSGFIFRHETPSAGSHTWVLQGKTQAGSQLVFFNAKLLVMEI